MPDAVLFGLLHAHWLMLLLAGVTGAAAGWLAVMLLLYPQQPRGIPGLLPVQGYLHAHHDRLSAFVLQHLLSDLPPPRRFFEQLGPDRFRREFARSLRERIDEHVDDVMTRRNGRSWEGLSGYARNRIYSHVHRRLPYVVDDFVDHVQRELDDIVHPGLLVRRHFAAHPEQLTRIFIECFGGDLRGTLLLAALLAMLASVPFLLWGGGILQWTLVGGAAALTGSLLVLLRLSWPVLRGGIWPLQTQGILHRHRQRFVNLLVGRVVDGALAWRSIVGEFLRGAHAGRVRHMMRREVAAILDVPVFRTSMQLLLGPEGFAEVKSSAVEKAVEMLASAPVSATLREHYRVELQRTLDFAAGRVTVHDLDELWRHILARAWRFAPVLALLLGSALGWLAGTLGMHFGG